MPSRSRGSPKLTTTQKGLGHDHQTNRARLLTRHPDGRPCWWCGKPMYRDPKRNHDGHPLEAHHSQSRSRFGYGKTRADMLLHKICNIQCGDGTHDDQRPTNPNRTDVDLTQPETDLGTLAIGWPTTWLTSPD